MTQVLYAAKAGALTTSDLYTVNPASAATTSVGAIGYAVTGLAFDPTSEILYGVTSPQSSASPKALITVDTTTGAGTVVGSMGDVVADICFDSAGVLYGWKPGGASNSNKLATINKATGTLSHLAGPSGVINTHGGGLACDADDLLWLFTGNTFTDIFTVDRTTGVTTDVGDLDGTDLASTDNVGAASFDGTGVLYGVCVSNPSILFTVGAVAAGIYPLVSEGAFSGTNWDALAWSIEAAPPPPPSTIEGVSFAFTDSALEPAPTWTRIDL